LGGQRRVAAQQLADAADDQVVGAGLGVDALRAGLAEGGSHAVDEDDLTQRAGHGTSASSWPARARAARLKLPVGNPTAKRGARWGSGGRLGLLNPCLALPPRPEGLTPAPSVR
jgi:hypothetical protein